MIAKNLWLAEWAVPTKNTVCWPAFFLVTIVVLLTILVLSAFPCFDSFTLFMLGACVRWAGPILNSS